MNPNSTQELKVIYEDSDIIVVDKPYGLVVNKSESQKDNITLQDLIEDKLDFESSDQIIDGGYDKSLEFLERSGIVHRIDAATSGLVLVAKNARSFTELQKQFKERRVVKKYLALCHGFLDSAEIGDEFTINAPISRNPKTRQKFAIVANGKESVTDFKVIGLFEHNGKKYTYLECYPKTGRTHQIRVHLASLNLPIVGDTIYSGRIRIRKYKDIFSRMFLHASYLKIIRSETKKTLEFESELPDELYRILEIVKNN